MIKSIKTELNLPIGKSPQFYIIFPIHTIPYHKFHLLTRQSIQILLSNSGEILLSYQKLLDLGSEIPNLTTYLLPKHYIYVSGRFFCVTKQMFCDQYHHTIFVTPGYFSSHHIKNGVVTPPPIFRHTHIKLFVTHSNTA